MLSDQCLYRPITIWERWNTHNERWEHNHIENGWIAHYPTPISELQQRSWKDVEWRGSFAILNHKQQVINDEFAIRSLNVSMR